jgi:Tfp pilus assembly protein PilN
MIQFNLLPDVKQVYIKARRTKRLAIVVASTVGGIAIALFIILFLIVNVVQKRHLSDLNADIKTSSAQLENTPDLNKILTIQNQLNSLPALHAQKAIASRLPGYLAKLTPAKVSINKLQIDFAAKTMTITGTADSLSTVNQYADTLKFTKYTLAGSTDQTPAFSNVVLSSFGRADKTTTYNITCTFDFAIFDYANTVKLSVPKIITTRSETEKPGALFQAPAAKKGGQ